MTTLDVMQAFDLFPPLLLFLLLFLPLLCLLLLLFFLLNLLLLLFLLLHFSPTLTLPPLLSLSFLQNVLGFINPHGPSVHVDASDGSDEDLSDEVVDVRVQPVVSFPDPLPKLECGLSMRLGCRQ